MELINQRWTLSRYPAGLPSEDDFRFETAAVPELADGEVLLAVRIVSLDPGQRFLIEEAAGMVPLGGVVPAWIVGEVIASRSPDYPIGTLARDVMAQGGVQRYSVVKATDLVPVRGDAPLSWYAGALGMSGQTAYFGLLDVGRPLAGETVLVSGATGAVGSIAAQIARIKGARVVGIARGTEKTQRLIDDFRLDAAIDASAENISSALQGICPGGVNLFFDTVGGEVLEAVLPHMVFKGRIASAGMIASYNRTVSLPGLRNYEIVFGRALRWEGVFVGGYVDRYAEATAQLEAWARSGELVFEEHVGVGLQAFPGMFKELFARRPIGKMLIRVDEAG
jgi:NADPH-dependent curcumin reductase CurA